MGMEGSWSGPAGGGYREYFLVKMLIQDLGLKSFLLFGTGNAPTFVNLREEGVDVIGCDISRDVVEYKKAAFGDNSFFTPASLPTNRKYDGIIAVEVFEHLTEPKNTFSLLMSRLRPHGVICGTTNFYLGTTIEDNNTPGYMSLKTHVAYWSFKSISRIAQDYDYAVVAFEMIGPWPNKRVFFLYNPHTYQGYFENLLKTQPILPIDRP
jgi:SAM-dependent methyltransferase